MPNESFQYPYQDQFHGHYREGRESREYYNEPIQEEMEAIQEYDDEQEYGYE